MFPKVVWKKFGLYLEEENRLFIIPAAYSNKREIIYLNIAELVKPEGIYLIYDIFHEFIHHIFNILDLPMHIDHILDTINAFRNREFVNEIYNGKTEFVFLDDQKIYKAVN